jgi:hypothetical protein
MFMASGILLQYSEHGILHEQIVTHDLIRKKTLDYRELYSQYSTCSPMCQVPTTHNYIVIWPTIECYRLLHVLHSTTASYTVLLLISPLISIMPETQNKENKYIQGAQACIHYQLIHLHHLPLALLDS